ALPREDTPVEIERVAVARDLARPASARPLLGGLLARRPLCRLSALHHSSAATLEILDGPLMPLGLGARGESAEVAPPAGLGVLLARVEPILAGLELADRGA